MISPMQAGITESPRTLIHTPLIRLYQVVPHRLPHMGREGYPLGEISNTVPCPKPPPMAVP
jgi:hypothetical protein